MTGPEKAQTEKQDQDGGSLTLRFPYNGQVKEKNHGYCLLVRVLLKTRKPIVLDLLTLHTCSLRWPTLGGLAC
jgi:hypothetical protein